MPADAFTDVAFVVAALFSVAAVVVAAAGVVVAPVTVVTVATVPMFPDAVRSRRETAFLSDPM